MAHKKDVSMAIELFYQTLLRITPEWIDDVKNPTSSYLS
jgi:hypothetical protein